MPTSSKPPATERRAKFASPGKPHELSRDNTRVPAGILDQLQDAIFTIDLHGTITSCNQAVSRYGYTQQDLIGQNLSELLGGEDPGSVAMLAMTAAVNQGRFEGDLCFRGKTGQSSDVRLCLSPLKGTDGSSVGMVGLSIAATRNHAAGSTSVSAPTSAGTIAIPLARREIGGTQFVIASPIMHKFMGMVDRVAGHTETVLVVGETGTGKELVARTIHETSYRHKNALIDINCAALPEHLVESELFGYEKGAFSGADSSKAGLFELADKSTIFLDEIGELQPQIQVKLLRVLDGQPYYRLGGNRKITVDVRVVAATNQDLELAVKEGRFRKDLYHRLGQFQLRVPPLRERPEDVVALARHFLSLKAAGKSFTVDALSALQAHSWPGNIRELRNLVAKLAMATDERQITAAEVLAEFHGDGKIERRNSGAVPLGNLDNMEEQMIIRALEHTGGHRTQAAERLGISRRTLSRKLREYEIDVRPGEEKARLGTISEQQQAFFRAKVSISVTLRSAQGRELQVHATNLSTGGMGLDAVADPNGFAGLVDVSFLLPESDTEMQAKGRLVWTEAGGRAGLRFVVIEPVLFEQLQHWTNEKMKNEGWEIPS